MSEYDVLPEDDARVTEAEAANAEAERVAKCLVMTSDEFNALKAADKALATFLVVREAALAVRSLEFRVNDAEAKVRELMSPDGIQKAMAMFMGPDGPMGGGLMKALSKGMF